jgi:S-adenosylmethionine hydrolase
MSKPIAFLTDLGTDDATGMCKGLMLCTSPDSQIIDITHAVPPFDVYTAAHYLSDLPEYFPSDTVFCCIVYPETGAVPGIVLENDRGQLFVAADNGGLTMVAANSGVRRVHQIDNPRVMHRSLSPSFYGRDVLVACAAHLAAGFPLESVGAGRDAFVTLDLPAPAVEDSSLAGRVSLIDKTFGNVWTNIPQSLLEQVGLRQGDVVEVRVGEVRHRWPFARTFADVGKGEALAYYNSRGHLAFAKNQGDLAADARITRGLRVQVRKG